MSRNRLSDLNASSSDAYNTAQQRGGYGNNYDLEQNGNLVAGERYELQDRSTRQLSLNDFLEEINDSKEATSRLDAQITRIEQLHAKSLPTTDESVSHVELDSLIASTSSLINSIRATLESLGNDARLGGNDAQKKLGLVNAQRGILRERVRRFQNVEKAYRDKLRDQAIRQYRIVNPDVSEQEISSALVDPNTQIFQQALMSSTRSSQARSKLSEVQSRHNDILVIERKITELAQMFNELGIIIELQNDQIDSIVIQAEDTRDNITQGLAQVTRATKLAAAVRRRKWWCFLIIVLIIIIIVVIVVVTQVVNKKTGGNNGG